MTVSKESLAEHFNYEPLTGIITWKKSRPKGSAKPGDEAGTITQPRSNCRYRTITLSGKKIYAHRVAWILVHGEIPAGKVVDHIDGDGLNNCLTNLRLATRGQNQRNSKVPRNNNSGHMNIWPHPNGTFRVQVASRYIGIYPTVEDAIEARDKAYQELGFHKNHGRKAS